MTTKKKKKKKNDAGAAQQLQSQQVASGSKFSQEKLHAKVLKVTAKLQKPGLLSDRRQTLQLKLDKLMAHLARMADAAGPAAAPPQPASVAPGLSLKFTAPRAGSALKAGLAGVAAVKAQTPEELARRLQRNRRFHDCCQPVSGTQSKKETLRAARAAALTEVYGENANLEKEYLRLTSMPTLDAVRPPHVLHSALKLVQARWLQDANYAYACEQLKSIRQDLTVQHICDKLTVYTYETHARIALEVPDYAEFHQCQTMLKQLFSEGVPGNRMEFASYGLLYTATHNATQLTQELRGLGQAVKHPYLQHALQAITAYQQQDCAAFLDLYADAPRMSPYLMDTLLDKLRSRALKAWIFAYLPSFPLALLQLQLGFDSRKEAAEFAVAEGAVVDMGLVDAKLSRSAVVGPLGPGGG
ncbi:hypothetical protein WJX72_001324 [[Myrmecia] bisecta]|uniref:PCI domain-containing protein n=1 Tax=[Myrmecia] bisecta TaxID=41462 RepID=A0AAW1PX80_9CHLO